MKRVTTVGLCVALGLWVPRAYADDPVPAPLPAVALGRPEVPVEPARRSIAEARLAPVSCPPPAIAISAPVARAQRPDTPQPLRIEPGRLPVALTPDPDPVHPRALEANSVWRRGHEDTGFATERGDGGPLRVVSATVLDADPPPFDGAEPCGECPPDGPPPSTFYFQAEYLLWRSRAANLPPLVTTGPVVVLATTPPMLSTQPGANGILGPGTTILFGATNQDYPVQSGARFTAGWRPDACKPLGFEASYFFLGKTSSDFTVSSNLVPLLARPFFNLNANREDVQLTAFPGISTGSISVSAPTRLWGAEGNLRPNLCCGCWYNVDLLVGVRYLELREDLTITEQIVSQINLPPTPIQVGTPITVFDSFATRNQFTGGQLGTVIELNQGRWSLDLRGKVALGDTHQEITINGAQVLLPPNAAMNRVVVDQGGLLALATNIGRFTRDRFSAVPEVGVNVGYRITDHLRAFVGYNFLYWSNVVRPADQIDRVLDASFIPNFLNPQTGQPFTPTGALRPMVPFRQTDYWAQGINFGLEFRY